MATVFNHRVAFVISDSPNSEDVTEERRRTDGNETKIFLPLNPSSLLDRSTLPGYILALLELIGKVVEYFEFFSFVVCFFCF